MNSGWQYGVKLTFAALVSNHKPTSQLFVVFVGNRSRHRVEEAQIARRRVMEHVWKSS
jgi:hypothetical protein